MTEQEKMKQGYLWQDDEENMALQAKAKDLVRRFNTLPPEDMAGREALLDGMYSFPIAIGDNVWLGANVVVLPGVTIGDNAVIGAGSMVTKDIPANVIAFGSPCKPYRPIDERDREYYFKDRRFDRQPE